MLVTVFTPVFNRAKSIRAVYDSLCVQSDMDFEWLVINDGSTDRTGEILEEIVRTHQKKFTINYIKKQNEGLNRTINRALDLAKGTLLMRLDSDDVALPEAIALIHKKYALIKDNPKLCAVAFCSLRFDGKLNGFHPFETDFRSDFTSFRYIHNGRGDRSEVMKVDVFRNNKFPEYEGENFCPEALVWNRIAKEYDCIYAIEAIYKKGFDDDSITAKIYATLKRCCQGSCTLYFEALNNDRIPFKGRLGSAVRYYRYVLYAKRSLWRGIPVHLAIIAFPIGMMVVAADYIAFKCINNKC